MKNHSENSLCDFFLTLSALIMMASLAGGAALILGNEEGGFFPGLGKALALVLIAAGNLLSWLLNLFCWYRTRRRWLGRVLAIQTLPAMLFAGWLATMGLDGFQESRASDQRTRLYNAIETDDIPAFRHATDRCGDRCREFFSPQRALLLAALHRSHQVARHILDEQAADGFEPFRYYDGRISLTTCEGTYLPALSALDLAVANEDMEMLRLLWPVSDDSERSAALWVAAQLDRLDMVKFMSGVGNSSPSDSSPLIRERYQGDRQTLLRPAAAGAALEVGHWLLATRPVALPQTEIQQALSHLLSFAHATDTPRAAPFAGLLLQHGADIHAATLDDEPALERAVQYRSRALASLLLELGADRSRLSGQEEIKLEALLQQPERLRMYRRNTPRCVAP